MLLQGEAAWEIIQCLSDSDAIAYLEDRKSRGVNALIVELIEHKFTAHTPRSANVAGHVPFSNNNDFTTTQDAYFADAERFVQQALARGFLLFMTPSYIGYGCGDEGWCAEMKANGVAKLTQYGRYVGQRFRNYPNIIWVEGGDHTPATTGNPSRWTSSTRSPTESSRATVERICIPRTGKTVLRPPTCPTCLGSASTPRIGTRAPPLHQDS